MGRSHAIRLRKSGACTTRISGRASTDACGGMWFWRGGTNLLRLGAGSQWIVAAKATLPRTMPRREFKSSAKDSAHRPFGTTFPGVRAGCLDDRQEYSPCHVPLGAEAPTSGRRADGGLRRRIFSADSDLEAFSHNPAHGSFAPLAFQPSAMTNCVNQRFLSY